MKQVIAPSGVFDVEVNDSALILSQGNLRYELPTVTVESFPESPPFGATPIMVESRELRRAIGLTEFAITQEEGRYTLSGAKVVINREGFWMIATDGHRLAFARMNGKSRKAIEALIPRRTLGLASKLSRLADVTRLGFTSEHVSLSAGNCRMVSRLLMGKFPDYEAVIPRNVVRLVEIDSQSLASAVRHVEVTAEPRSHSLQLSFNETGVTVSADDGCENKARDVVPISGDGEPVSIFFNGQYLREFCEKINGLITMELTDPTTQVLLKPKTSCGLIEYFHLIMPMKP